MKGKNTKKSKVIPADKLARMMLDLAAKKAQVARMEARIAAHVLETQETISIAGVTGKYSGGRATYDWEGTANATLKEDMEPEDFERLVAKFTTTIIPEPVTTTNWRELIKYVRIDPIVAKQPVPKVTFSLKE